MKALQAPLSRSRAVAPARGRPVSSLRPDPSAAAAAAPRLDLEERQERAARLGHRAADLLVKRHPAPAVPVAVRPGAEQGAPIQPAWDWKKKLAAGVGVAGLGGLVAGAALAAPALAIAGGAALLGGAAYGAYRYFRDRRQPRQEAAQDLEEPLRGGGRGDGERLSASAAAAAPAAARRPAPLAEVPGGERFPPNMHFVWLGGEVPADRRQNIGRWRDSARGVTPNLWLDENSERASAEHLGGLAESGVRIRRVGDLDQDNARFANARRLLPTVDEGSGVNRAATGAMSDIARLEILRQEGGHYMDSDNAPGAEAHRFATMSSAAGVRLGHGALGEQAARVFSNDAMSAQPNNQFINDYLDRSYGLLDERSAAEIRSRDPERTRPAVMNTTGPGAMAHVLLPASEAEAASARDEMQAGDVDLADRITINTFMHSDNLMEHRDLHPTLRAVYGRIGYGRELFDRGLGNAWVEPARRSGDDEKDK
jgi:mannosyltransferase OCH1-like enzyme